MSNDNKIVEKTLREGIAEIKRLRKKLKQAQKKVHQPIAIIGMSCRYPGDLNTPEQFWDFLKKGNDAVAEVPADRWDVNQYYDSTANTLGKMNTRLGGFLSNIDLFDHNFFNITPKEAKFIDPQQRILLELTWEAFENAGIAPFSFPDRKVGVFIGAATSEYGASIFKDNDSSKFTAELGTSITLSAISGRISYFYNFQGPCMTLDTACSSSLVSLHEACNSLRLAESNLAIAGGVQLILLPEVNVSLSHAHMLSPDGHCKTFDESANGYARSEGAGLVLLKRLDDAIADGDPILAVIRGSSISQDGASSGLTVPNGIAQENLIIDALHHANLSPADISQIEAHGTGTALGDPIEFIALKEVFSKDRDQSNPLYLSSVKANMGHAEVSAGVMALMKQVLSLQHKQIVPQIHFHTINPKIKLETIPAIISTELSSWQVPDGNKRRVGISSFGFTGVIAHAILEEAPTTSEVKHENLSPQLITISAKTKEGLIALLKSYTELLKDSPSINFNDFAFTQNIGREDFSWRLVIVASNPEDFLTAVNQEQFVIKDVGRNEKQRVVFEYDHDIDEPEIHESSHFKRIKLNTKMDLLDIFSVLADDYLSGSSIDWSTFYKPYHFNKIVLPNYPFQRKRHWLEFNNKVDDSGVGVQENAFEKLSQEVFELKKTVQQMQMRTLNTDRKSIITHVKTVVKQLVEIDDISELSDKNLLEIGMSSLTMNELRLILNDKYGCDLSVSFIAGSPRLDQISDEIYNQINHIGQPSKNNNTQSKWIAFRERQQNAKIRLFCFPYGGVGASCFHDWQKGLSNKIEVCPIQLPGRETRFDEPKINQFDELLDQLYKNIEPELIGDFAFFGHSIGGLYAYELMRRIEEKSGKLPVKLFLSAAMPPNQIPTQNNAMIKYFADKKIEIDSLKDSVTDSDLLSYLKMLIEVFHLENEFDLDQIAKESIGAHKILVQTFFNDINLQLSYRYQQGKKINCPVTVFSGTKDKMVTELQLLQWRDLFSNDFEIKKIEGGHLFLKTQLTTLLAFINSCLSRFAV